MEHEEWLEERRKNIGGSDAPVLLGLNKYKTKYQLWLDKMGLLPDFGGNAATEWGNRLESVVADAFAEASGLGIEIPEKPIYLNDKYPRMHGTPDRLTSDNGVLEIKTTGAHNKHVWDDGVPPHVNAQLQHYLMILDRPHGYVAVLIGGQDFRWWRVEADEEMQENIFSAVQSFWEDHIATGVPPQVSGEDELTVNKIYDTSNGETVEIDDDILELVGVRNNVADQIATLETEKKSLEATIKMWVGDNETVVCDGTKVLTWKEQSKTSFDVKAFEKDNPDLAEKYRKTSSYRVLRFTKGTN